MNFRKITVTILFFIVLCGAAVAQDICADILKFGVFDTSVYRDQTYGTSAYSNFLNHYKESEAFQKDAEQSNWSGGVSYGVFGGSASAGSSSSRENYERAIDALTRSQQGNEESRRELFDMSRTASPEIVRAWSNCMDRKGFFVSFITYLNYATITFKLDTDTNLRYGTANISIADNLTCSGPLATNTNTTGIVNNQNGLITVRVAEDRELSLICARDLEKSSIAVVNPGNETDISGARTIAIPALVAYVPPPPAPLPDPYLRFENSSRDDKLVHWNGGAGWKNMTSCNIRDNLPDVVVAVRNVDFGNNNQSFRMYCQALDVVAAMPPNSAPACSDVNVSWTGGRGLKEWAVCPEGRVAHGFRLRDRDRNDQHIGKMRCCSLPYMDGGDTLDIAVTWSGGRGEKIVASCPQGYVISGIRNEDYGNHDQGVGMIKCKRIFN